MQMPIQMTTNFKTIVFGATLVALALVLVVNLFSPAAHASSLASVSSNIADVPGGANLVLRVAAHNDGNLAELEIDHSMAPMLPEFSVYANEANPYGDSEADFLDNNVSVTYTAATSEWVIDFGPQVTKAIRDNNEGIIKFYFVLRKADSRGILWGSMNPVTPENTFTFDAANGTGDSLEADPQEDEEEVIVPGVPNTSFVL